MGAFGFTSTVANIKVAGLSSWSVRRAPLVSPDVGYYSLGNLADGKVTTNLLTKKDTKGYPIPYGITFEASAKMLSTPKTTVLQLLDHLVDCPLIQKITAVNAVTFTGPWGFKWRFDSSADYDGFRYIEVMANDRFIISGTARDWPDLLTTPATGSADAGDALYAWVGGQNAIPAGMTAFETRNLAESTWETLGEFRNGKIVADCMTTLDNNGRYRTFGVHVTIEADMMQASSTELALLDDVAVGVADLKATMADGTTFTFADNIGVSWSYHNETDSDGISFIHLVGETYMTPAAFVGIIA